MVTHPWKQLPLDSRASDALAAAGLDYRLVDVSGSEFPAFIKAVARGFLDEEPTDEQVGGARELVADRRLTGVYDASGADPATPVATIDSWMTELSLPGRTTIPMWAISGVTVSPTRRRRGIARSMIEGDLRTAADAGSAIAGLTVSEATIYGRFGFAPAAFATDWTLDTRRARWTGPATEGRVDAVDRERLRTELAAVHDRARRSRPGDIEGGAGLWRRLAGLAPGSEQRKTRGVIHTDTAGVVRGVMAYSIAENDDDPTRSTLDISLLIAQTDDAYRGLFRFALEHDLVATVKAPLRSVDEPLRWMIADQRGATVTTREHGWLRVLDVPTVLAARRYDAPIAVTLGVTDDLGFAHGVWNLEIDAGGSGIAEPVDASPDLSMTVNELGSMLLGGVRATTLQAAGRIDGPPAIVAALDRSFSSSETPFLSLWY